MSDLPYLVSTRGGDGWCYYLERHTAIAAAREIGGSVTKITRGQTTYEAVWSAANEAKHVAGEPAKPSGMPPNPSLPVSPGKPTP